MANIPAVASDTVENLVGETKIPLFEEQLSVTKRVVPTGRVQVSRVTHSNEQLIEELLNHEKVEIEKIPVDKPIDTMPSVRQDGDTIVIPVVEEVVRVERNLLLKEEVRIRRIRTTERFQESVMLRKQEVVVTRLPVAPPAASVAEARTDPTPAEGEANS